jgi:hypothetical protein
MLNGNVISFRSKPQSCTALSSCEAETVAICSASQEVAWLRNVLCELGIPQDSPTTVHCDNTGAIAFCQDEGNHTKMKHIAIRESFVKEAVGSGVINPVHVRTQDNPADIFTKALGPTLFRKHRQALNVAPRPICAEGAN